MQNSKIKGFTATEHRSRLWLLLISWNMYFILAYFFLEIVFEFSSQEDEIFNLSKQFNPQDLNRVMQHFKEIKRKN